jgi:predicted metal-dependent hydrolase
MMLKNQKIHRIEDIEFKIIYSGRRTIGISVLPDSSVVVRAPYTTSFKTISRIVNDKYSWVLMHRDNYRKLDHSPQKIFYTSGETHLFHGKKVILKIEKSARSYVRFYDNTIELGTNRTNDPAEIRRILYKGYKNEALLLFPELMKKVINEHEKQLFRPTGLVVRSMKRRWGSCSNKGKITLSTELIKLSDLYIEYVIAHELCHLKHHNHGSQYYKLLSEVFPDWKAVRKELRKYIQ